MAAASSPFIDRIETAEDLLAVFQDEYYLRQLLEVLRTGEEHSHFGFYIR